MNVIIMMSPAGKMMPMYRNNTETAGDELIENLLSAILIKMRSSLGAPTLIAPALEQYHESRCLCEHYLCTVVFHKL